MRLAMIGLGRMGGDLTRRTAAVRQRFASQGIGEMAGKVLSAMRQAFGDHLEKPGPLDGEGGDRR